MRFLSSRSGIAKIVVAILIVVVASAAAISYYVITQFLSQSASPTPTPSPEPTVTPAPTPTPIATPTSSSANPTPTPSPPELTTQERIRNTVMNYIKSNHPETAPFLTNLNWTGGRATPQNILGAETYKYYSQGWNFTIRYPVVPDPIYNIVADYSSLSIGIPFRIIWKGTWQNEIINETSYIFAQ